GSPEVFVPYDMARLAQQDFPDLWIDANPENVIYRGQAISWVDAIVPKIPGIEKALPTTVRLRPAAWQRPVHRPGTDAFRRMSHDLYGRRVETFGPGLPNGLVLGPLQRIEFARRWLADIRAFREQYPSLPDANIPPEHPAAILFHSDGRRLALPALIALNSS